MAAVLYYIIIYPIELLLETNFSLIYGIRHQLGLSIIGVSIVVNLLLLPIYRQADRISGRERKRQNDMAYWVGHIKKTFRGDERFMLLSAYYRKQHYHPLYSLSSSVSLLLQIPFFIAAYHFLSNLTILKGTGFLWITDLGAPDRMIVIPQFFLNTSAGIIPLGTVDINVLPILMTLINFLSILVFTKGAPLREKLQLSAMAVLFLVLLYNSPSGLVLYWTMNNVFSLIKSIVLKIKGSTADDTSFVSSLSSPLKKSSLAWLPGAFLLTVLTGMVIPSTVIVSSPQEFVTLADYKDPLQYIVYTSCIAAGFFLFWLTVFYFISPAKVRRIIDWGIWFFCGIALIDFLIFGKNLINLSSELEFDYEPTYGLLICLINMLVLLSACVVLFFFRRRFPDLIPSVYTVMIIGLIVLFSINAVRTETRLSNLSERAGRGSSDLGFRLSKNGKNVILIMLDRAIGAYVPFILTERPDLLSSFSGFTYYPNTISFSTQTITAAPALFGGYEYTPEEIDLRDTESLKDKHNEAISVLPVLFSKHGYRTTVYDIPLANYEEISDLSIYDSQPDIRAEHLTQRFVEPEYHAFTEKLRKRSFFMYSIYKISPLFLHHGIYDDGAYFYPERFLYPHKSFNDSYSILQNFINLTQIEDTDENTFMMAANDITHSPCELQLPDYTPSPWLNNTGLESGYRTDLNGNTMEIDIQFHYHVNMSAFLLLGKWLDYLKENDVYDNTKIIIAADHGSARGQFDSLILDDGTDLEAVNPLLLVKDFNAETFSVSTEFMTNADAPSIALCDLFENPVNPFTGIKIDNHKKEGEQKVYLSEFTIEEKNRNVFDKPGSTWYSVHDNLYNKEFWKRIK